MNGYSLLNMLLLFAITSQKSLCQDSLNLSACQVFEIDKKNETLSLHNVYIDKLRSTSKTKMLADLLSSRSSLRLYQNSRIKNYDVKFQDSIYQSSLRDINNSIALINDDKLKIEYLFRRHFIFKNKKQKYPEYNQDLSYLKKAGFKPIKIGVGMHLTSRYDGQFWLGGEISFPSAFSPKTELVNGYGNIFHSSRLTTASLLNLGILYNLANDWKEWKFSFFRVEAPIFLDILQVGQIRTPESNHFFYRPEVGYGYSMFSLSYGYNIYFKKGAPESISRHLLTFKIRYIMEV